MRFWTNPLWPTSRNGSSPPHAAPAPTPPTPLRSAACPSRSRSATAPWKPPSARKVTIWACAPSSGAARPWCRPMISTARIAPEDKFAGLATPDQLATSIPDLDLLDSELPSVARLETTARAAEAAGIAVKGVSKSGGASASAGIGGEGTGMEQDYDFSSAIHAADLAAPEEVGRSAGERAVRRLNPKKVATKRVPVVFDPRVAG